MKELTPTAEKFCYEYVVDFDKKAAAVRAGVNPVNAELQSQRWLDDPRCQAMIRELKHKVTLRMNISADWTLEKLRIITNTDITEALDLVLQWNGDRVEWMQKFRELPPEVRYIIKSIKWGKYGPEIVPYDKLTAAGMLAKYFNLLTDRLEVTGPGGEPMKMIHEGMSLAEAAAAYQASIKGAA